VGIPQGLTPYPFLSFPSTYEYVWDTSRWTPDLVVVDMGRNDGHGLVGWDMQFDEYHAYIDWLQEAYGEDIPRDGRSTVY